MHKILTILILITLLPAKSRSQQAACFYTNKDSSLRMESAEELKNYNNFIVGELHDHPQTPAIKLALIKYLHEQKQVNDVFLEIGHSAAWLYNQYLLTGDTGYITSPALVYATTLAGSRFWADLYEYNRASVNKITIHGIDFERMEFVKALRLLKDSGSSYPFGPASDFATIDTLHIQGVNDPRLVLIYERIRWDFIKHQSEYRRYFGWNYQIVMETMFNPATCKGYNKRDETMAANALATIQQRHIGAMVLFVGKKHVGSLHRNNMADILLRDMVFSHRNTCLIELK